MAPFVSFGFMRHAMVGCIALAIAQGPIGTLLLLRRQSLVGDLLCARGHAKGNTSVSRRRLLARGAVWRPVHRITGRRACRADAGGLSQRGAKPLSPRFSAWHSGSRRDDRLLLRHSDPDLMHVLFGPVLAVDR